MKVEFNVCIWRDDPRCGACGDAFVIVNVRKDILQKIREYVYAIYERTIAEEENEGLDYADFYLELDSLDLKEQLPDVYKRLYKLIKKGIIEQGEINEDFDIDDWDFSFDIPEELYKL